ncbi:hypothetical protein CGGC5_v011119 [Colletotrichum fructicola Nara gc5]|uniref:N-acetyltransferase domain-containing protein n=1 Tax=Colletotrichum fructicola (strain Nara gc5) TaxID=1213859 RepID=A0A7J6IWY2_COLFN|nr:hypothetical protein CGGC5_v011119 [Colletotrichum fructicola Nara gc5]
MRTHLNDFHEMCADEKACEWSSLRHTESLESSKKLMENTFTSTRQAPWLVTCAIMSSTYPTPDNEGGCCTKMIGCVRTTRASPWGLSVGYKIRSDCWGKGYATRALQLFLDEYWSQKRTAPKSDVYVSQIPAVNAVAFDKSLTGKIVDDRAQIPKMWEREERQGVALRGKAGYGGLETGQAFENYDICSPLHKTRTRATDMRRLYGKNKKYTKAGGKMPHPKQDRPWGRQNAL